MDKGLIILLNLPPSVDYSYVTRGSIFPGTAILLIGTLLKKNGYDVKIIDGAYFDNYLEILKECLSEYSNILYVGMSVMITQIPLALEASKLIKGYEKKIPIVWGGAHPSLYPEQTLRNDFIDIVVINEGAYASLELAEAYKGKLNFQDIKGIGYKNNGKELFFNAPRALERIDSLPHFDFSLIEISNYLNKNISSVYKREFPLFRDDIRLMPILTGLGCPYKCQFCINVIFKRRYRFRSAFSIVEEIKRLQLDYDANTFLFFDEDFFINKSRTYEFIAQVEKEGLKFNFRMWCRVDHFKDDYINSDMLKRLSDIGHGSLAMGAESSDPEILRQLKKDITPDQVKNSLMMISKYPAIFPRYSFMVGLENESIQKMKNTCRFCLDMKKIHKGVDIAGPFIFRLYPGSPIYERLVNQYNLEVPDSLESWSAYITREGYDEHMPWTPDEFQKNHTLLSFYSYYALISLTAAKNVPKRLVFWLLTCLSQFRLYHFLFYFPLEFWLYKFFKKKQNT